MYQAAQTRYKDMKYNRVGTSGLNLDNIKAVENTDFSGEEIKKINDIAL